MFKEHGGMSETGQRVRRRLPVGAEPIGGGTHFRVWAPEARELSVVAEGRGESPLEPEDGGYFAGFVNGAKAGDRYRFRVAGKLLPDPASRFQPDGVHGPSEIVDASEFRWTDDAWRGVSPAGQVLYEMHVGTFTREGTWRAATEKLPLLHDVGVTCIEMMPVAEFGGEFGWGYDGVDFFAPTRLYGRPDDLRAFVDRAHALGIGVILDVVYNHLGPTGNHLPDFAKAYFTDKQKNAWGQSINFDGEGSGPVREFFLANARYWIEEFHFDGYRFDATQAIVDDSPRHILAEICSAARQAGGKRSVYLVNENEPQETKLVRPAEQGGYCLDALWNDDFHHSASVALTGRNEAYYTDFLGTPQEFVSAAKWGYLFQGQRYNWQRKRRGTPALDLPPTAFVNFIQNHDQIANSARGQRIDRLTSFPLLKAVTAAILLMPQTPMLFQGQEFMASSPFLYFANHEGELAKLVCGGRANELSEFPSIATREMTEALADPCDRGSFERSKLDWGDLERSPHREMWELHRDLLRLRREDPVFARVQRRGDVDGAVLGEAAFVLRYFSQEHGDRLVVVNLGRDLSLNPAPEPLLAPPEGMRWEVVLATEDPRYLGNGAPAPETEQEGWRLTGRNAVVLRPRRGEGVRTRSANR